MMVGLPGTIFHLPIHLSAIYHGTASECVSVGANGGCSGRVRNDLFHLRDDGILISSIVAAANNLLSLLTPDQLSKTIFHIDAPEWRTWSNPEFLLSNKGIRLDEVSDSIRSAALNLLKETLSPEGYEKALGAMRINGFLGELVGAPQICGEFSYNVCFFGTPSEQQAWGFQWYGHHLCLNIFLYRSTIVVSPFFTGAEPNGIDDGPYKGTRILHEEERLGLELMRSLEGSVRDKVQVFKELKDPGMEHGRWNHDDQRHLCGAYRDNRVVPYEGAVVSSFSLEQQALVKAILNQFLLYLPQRARELRIEECERWFHETYFCWIGGYRDGDAFYYRIQSPVVIVEFDHHSGVFLTNKEPKRFHIHTLLRTPNGGDYGMALRKECEGIRQEWVWEGDKE